jgi:NAD(P)-dependent dehydrogenase (short-subunit alcohol dehydrogenase family)
VAVVTGGSSGIGRATALLLARRGAIVFTGDTHPRSENARAFADLGITELTCDVRREDQVRELMERAARDAGLHILVSNAGIDLEAQLPEVSEEQWNACLDTNLKGAFLACKYAIPRLRAAGGGAVVFTSSNAGLMPRAHDPVYCTRKAALIALAGSLALCHARDKIRFNSVCPGPVSGTGIIDGSLSRPDRAASERRFIDASPLARAMGRMITPEEVAEATLYLVSDVAALVTGTALRIDGGKSLGVPPRSQGRKAAMGRRPLYTPALMDDQAGVPTTRRHLIIRSKTIAAYASSAIS